MTAYAPSISFPGPRLVRAEVLKLRKRRGLVVTTAVLTVGATLILYTILAAVHASDASKHGPAGGVANLGYGMLLISLLGGVAAILAGVLAGSGDLGAGVFRELVVTGRSRRALFNARIPGGLAFVLPFVAVAYAITAVVSVVAAGSLAAPSVGLLVSSGVWMLLTIAFWYAVAVGVASLLGSSTTSLGILLAFKLALAPVVVGITALGIGREAIPGVGLDRLAPHAVRDHAVQGVVTPMSVTAAVATLVLTVVVALALGSWRTQSRDA